ncbi:multisubunit Na+/H+ antiporter MnhE subunit [Bradyrhizobium sp. USDA 4472]
MTALIGLILGMLLGIVIRELWPRRRELLMAALLLLAFAPILWFMVQMWLHMPRG